MTDTEKWKKPFVRGLKGPYKLLWLYICDDCDHAGVWQVDIEVASIRIGEKIDLASALKALSENIEVFDGGRRWFIPGFVDFQYGELNEKNRVHNSVIQILKKYNLGKYKEGVSKPLSRGQGQGLGLSEGEGKGERQEQGPDFSDYQQWTDAIIDGNDYLFWNMATNEKIPRAAHTEHWVRDHLGLLGRYPNMKPPNQQRFRDSCLKHVRENFKNNITANGNTKTRKEQQVANAVSYVANHYGINTSGGENGGT